jgi:hypothetical protein
MSAPATDVNTSAKESLVAVQLIDQVERGLAEPADLPARLEEPNLPAVREAAGRMFDLLVHVGSSVLAVEVKSSREGTDPQRLAERALLRNYDSFRALRQRRPEWAAYRIVESLLDELEGTGTEQAIRPGPEAAGLLEQVRREVGRRLADEQRHEPTVPDSSEWLVLYSQAVEEVISRSVAEGQTRTALRSLMTHLAVGQDDLGRLFAVSGETVRRWERGRSRIPRERGAAILAVESALGRLLEVFRPERLPLVVRRKADLFDGETALEWILRGRIDEVVDRYDRTFAYQA